MKSMATLKGSSIDGLSAFTDSFEAPAEMSIDPDLASGIAEDLIAEANAPVSADDLPRRKIEGMPLKLLLVAALLGAALGSHYFISINNRPAHDVLLGAQYIPVLLAAMFFGLPGALVTGGIAVGFTFGYVLYLMGGDFFGMCLCHTMHMITLGSTSAIAGTLFDRSYLATRRVEVSRDRLNEATGLLQETSHRLKDSLGKLRLATVKNKETEEQLRRAERLNALGKLSAGLAHEIRNPLASIRGSAEILKVQAAGNENLGEFVQIIEQETDRLDETLRRILEFAQSDTAEEGAANPAQVIEEVVNLIERSASKRDVAILPKLGANLERAAILPIHLRQVLLNLLLNAVQALEKSRAERREVYVGALYLRDTSNKTQGEIRVFVADTGDGIDPETAAQIFDPFFTTKDEGTGLGLAIVDRIVRDAAGEIRYVLPEDRTSELGLPAEIFNAPGGLFIIDLPAVPDE